MKKGCDQRSMSKNYTPEKAEAFPYHPLTAMCSAAENSSISIFLSVESRARYCDDVSKL